MSGWRAAKRILAVRLDSLGDVLMCTPAIRALGRHGAEVTLLTSPAGAAIAELVPEIDHVITWSAPWMKATPRADAHADRAMIDRLMPRQFDAAVIFTCYSQNPLPAALLCHLAGVPLRAAYTSDKPYALLSDAIPEIDRRPGEGRDPGAMGALDSAKVPAFAGATALRHEARRQLDLVAALGFETEDERLSLTVPPAARPSIAAKLADWGITDDCPWAVLHPGASAESRRWPPAAFAAVARALLVEHGWRIVIAGGGAERALIEAIAAGAPGAIVAGELDLARFAALLEAAPLLIANNSGPMHMAAALGTPVVCLYALTNPQHTPWMTPSIVLNHDVPCRWCERSICPEGHHHCLRLVAPEQVVAAALELTRVPAPA